MPRKTGGICTPDPMAPRSNEGSQTLLCCHGEVQRGEEGLEPGQLRKQHPTLQGDWGCPFTGLKGECCLCLGTSSVMLVLGSAHGHSRHLHRDHRLSHDRSQGRDGKPASTAHHPCPKPEEVQGSAVGGGVESKHHPAPLAYSQHRSGLPSPRCEQAVWNQPGLPVTIKL